MNIYIAGPMRGHPEFNHPSFFAAEAVLNSAGHSTFNPARRDAEEAGLDVTGMSGDMGEVENFSLREALHADMEYITLHADAIYMLEGWENSSGARAEKALAEALCLKVIYQAGGAIPLTPSEQEAFDSGYQQGWDEGYHEGWDQGEQEGYHEGWDEGQKEGYNMGIEGCE